MKIESQDLPWITALVTAILFFLNIFIPRSAPIYQIAGKQAFPTLESSIDNTPSNQVELTASPTVYREIKSKLPLELLGTIIGNRSLAFIYNSDTKKQGVYGLHDFIDDYKIISIAPAKVILVKNDSVRALLLKGYNSKDAEDIESIVSEDASGTLIISKSQLMSHVFDTKELLNQVKVLPLLDAATNKLKGFRIENIPPGSIIEKVGIKSGDIIYSIQGKKLQSIQDAWQTFNTIQDRDESPLEVVLLRDEKPVTLKYEIKK